MKHPFNKRKWTWYDLPEGDTEDLIELTDRYPACSSWYDSLKENHTNFLHLNTKTKGEEYIWGSLVYQQNIEEKKEKNVFHFYICKDFFVTLNFDFHVLNASNPDDVKVQMEDAETGVEGFLILLGEILSNYLLKIDEYEEKLHHLIWKIKEQNNLEILEEIYQNRHELLIWKNLLVPIIELKFVAEEAYGKEISESMEFCRLSTRLERARTILGEYQQEIDTMIDLEEVVSSHRGNEIMKTLTVMTILFTPVMAWGALWGMNFKFMPELKWKYGYLYAGILILLSTFGLYAYLKMKGWMGDILKGRKKNSFFK